MEHCFTKVKKNFGFGCMRLPMKDGQPDYEATNQMIDTFLQAGFNYFDTAHGYMGGKSELVLRQCLTSRYPRESYVLTNKLTGNFFNSQEEIRPLFEQQLQCCGVEYFDFYLMHAQDKMLFAKYKRCRAYETALQLQKEGKIRHFGISFHDKAVVLDQILTEYPQVELVQIQLNYVDYEDPSVESRKCLEVCHKHGKPAVIMEPVKGGSLVKLPEAAQRIFDARKGGSNASYAIRFAASQEGVMMVLSGMSNLAMVEENCGYMQDFQPLDEDEQKDVQRVCEIFRSMEVIPCTACRYCLEVCPKGIAIPELFACLNSKKVFRSRNAQYYYEEIHTAEGKKASDCLACGLCEKTCPQHLPIRQLLKTVAEEFENE